MKYWAKVGGGQLKYARDVPPPFKQVFVFAIKTQKRIFVLYAKNLLMEKESTPNVILVIKKLDLTTSLGVETEFFHK